MPHPLAEFIEIFVDSRTVCFKVDTRAEVVALPATFPCLPSQLQLAQGQLTGPGNNVLNLLARSETIFMWKGISTVHCIYVLPTMTTLLLGFPAIEAPCVI